jgi:hypothetical protein
MVFDDVVIKSGQTLSGLVEDYGHPAWEWENVWNHEKNALLRQKRSKPEKLMVGDILVIPIPWVITHKKMTSADVKFFRIDVERNGGKGKYLRWVQTVFRDNQPINTSDIYTVDYIDDDDPFYYTSLEVATKPTYKKHFSDTPKRPPAARTTNWRAVLSICSVSDKRVSVFETIVWGVDFGKNGTNSKYLPRPATPIEIEGHLNILRNGMGKTKNFKSQGWSFRRAPSM